MMRCLAVAALGVFALIAGCAKPPAQGQGRLVPIAWPMTGTATVKAKDGSVVAQLPVPAPSGKPMEVKGMDETVANFFDICLDKFPDDQAAAAKLTTLGFQPLSNEQTAKILKQDPGRGWAKDIAGTAFVVTIELPPFHSCAVHARLATEPDVGVLMAMSVGLWASKQTPPEMLQPIAFEPLTLADGTVEQMRGFVLAGLDQKPIERVGAYIAHYPGTEQVELRLVRMRGDNPH